jgi:glucokinase
VKNLADRISGQGLVKIHGEVHLLEAQSKSNSKSNSISRNSVKHTETLHPENLAMLRKRNQICGDSPREN